MNSAADLVRENYRAHSGVWLGRMVAASARDPRIRTELEDFHRRLGIAIQRVGQERALKTKWARCPKSRASSCPVCTEPGQRGHPAYLYAYVPKVAGKGGRWELVKEGREERARRLEAWLRDWERERVEAALIELDTIQRHAASTADEDPEAREQLQAWIRAGGVHG